MVLVTFLMISSFFGMLKILSLKAGLTSATTEALEPRWKDMVKVLEMKLVFKCVFQYLVVHQH